MNNIINSDPTLKAFIKDNHIDWNNEHQINLRCKAIEIALWKYLNWKY